MKKGEIKSLNAGFTLVELASVLVVIGLIVTGIVSGKELIKNSRMSGVITSAQNYIIAVSNFKEEFGGFPGDINNADTLWAGAANGNSDDQVLTYDNEGLDVWMQLAASDSIKGRYTGATADGDNIVIGTDIPAGSFDNTGYWLQYEAAGAGYAYENGNYIKFASPNLSSGNGGELLGGLTPEDARTIDLKMDDSVSSTGNIFGVNGADVQGGAGTDDCFVSPTGPGIDDYQLTNTAKACQVWFILR